MATGSDNEIPPLIPEIRELSDAEWDQLVDDKARQYFGISARSSSGAWTPARSTSTTIPT